MLASRSRSHRRHIVSGLVFLGILLLILTLDEQNCQKYSQLMLGDDYGSRVTYTVGRMNVGFAESAITNKPSNSTTSRLLYKIPASPNLTLEERLKNDTAHSHTSPLSPIFRTNKTQLKPFYNCPATSQIDIRTVHNSYNQKDVWVIHTYDSQGNPKEVAGDEFYVTYTSYEDSNNTESQTIDLVTKEVIQHPSLVAIPTYIGNGQYELDFVIPPLHYNQRQDLGGGRNETEATSRYLLQATNNNNDIDDKANTSSNDGYLTIHFTFTCGTGLVTQKEDWKSRGSLDWKVVQHQVPRPPSVRPSQRPPALARGLRDYIYVAVFGDSVLGQFVGQYKGNPKFKVYPQRTEDFPSKSQVNYPFNTKSAYVNQHDHMVGMFHYGHGARLTELGANRTTTFNNKTATAILLDGGSWDLGAVTWKGADENWDIGPTVEAYRRFIHWLRQAYPGATVLWMSQPASHPHNCYPGNHPLVNDHYLQGNKYNSISRVEELEQATRRAMKELQVPVLDIYEATYTSATYLYPGNAQHYKSDLNRFMLMEWFF